MNGRSPSNCTSTTAPMTCVTRPTLFLAMIWLLSLDAIVTISDGFSARDDLDQFLGDVRLTRAVVVERQTLDHVARVAGGAVHRGHARAVLASGAFQQGTIDLDGQILRQQPGQDGLLVRLVLIG